MKKLILFSSIACVALSLNAQVPTYAFQSLGFPSTIAAATQTNFPFSTAPVIDCRKQTIVTVTFASRVSDLGSNVVLVLAPSVDGNWYSTNTGGQVAATDRLLTITWTNDITPRTLITNLDSRGIGYWKVLSIYNKSDGILTNYSAGYGVKISSP